MSFFFFPMVVTLSAGQLWLQIWFCAEYNFSLLFSCHTKLWLWVRLQLKARVLLQEPGTIPFFFAVSNISPSCDFQCLEILITRCKKWGRQLPWLNVLMEFGWSLKQWWEHLGISLRTSSLTAPSRQASEESGRGLLLLDRSNEGSDLGRKVNSANLD